ncbi:peptidoglycan/LPS O-acetylase OafA/YrhL [Jatrophihabitans sp. GAS493]|uniref:acyltransferase family protein n=1 Tax=Jatrophihabitans sp. GAS493 TaxID=1907575 RepID=UPI000BB9579C|nr:acyltransferase [Jatrophihabitans sp. GAS493]SOD70547.1 peptidoglycan/LPS O-acetylase OafA/YrhL [Jatrophihabitans sp. GAS493]
MESIAAAYRGRQNSLNFLRLLLAVTVLLAHQVELGGFGSDQASPEIRAGRWAVAGFFAISGFLITNSRRRRSFGSYLRHRFLRIYPAFLVCLILTAVIFAPLAQVIGPGRVEWGSAGHYVLDNLALNINQYDIRHTLDSVPFPQAWDGSLWTLYFEFACYLMIGLLLFAPLRLHRHLVLVAFVLLLIVASAHVAGGRFINYTELATLGTAFFAGALAALWSDRLRLGWPIAAVAAVACGVAMAVDRLDTLGAIPLTYLLLWLGARLRLDRVGARNDISYGIYIYAFPLQQLLVLLTVQHLGYPISSLLAMLLTVPVAAASWFAVERPALRLAQRSDRWFAGRAGWDGEPAEDRGRTSGRVQTFRHEQTPSATLEA